MTAAAPLALGLDVGTTLVTGVVMNAQGRTLATHSIPLVMAYPAPGLVEQDPQAILLAARRVVQTLSASHPVDAVALDHQGESFVLWDADTGVALTPNVVWQDQRGAAVCQRLKDNGCADMVAQRTGLLLDSYFTAPKVAALLEADSALRAVRDRGALRLGTLDSWLCWHGSGGKLHITEPSSASRTLLFNLHTLAWDPDLLDVFGVTPQMLPAVVPTFGTLSHHVDLGAPTPLPLGAVAVDQQAALFGQGCVHPGNVKCTLGTGAFVLMNTGNTAPTSHHGLLSTVAWQPANAPAVYALDGGVFTVGAAVQWLAEGLGLLSNAAQSAEVAARATHAESLVVVPALAGLGAPVWLTAARGAVFGASRSTTAADVVRATLRGLACLVDDVVQAMAADARVAFSSLRVDGGPSANAVLVQDLADVCGMAVHVAAEAEATARGAAMMALCSLGAATPASCAAMWQSSSVLAPRLNDADRAALRQRWQRALNALRCFHADGAAV